VPRRRVIGVLVASLLVTQLAASPASATDEVWTGTISSMTASPGVVTPGESSYLSVRLSEPLPTSGPVRWATSIYDETGHQVTFCAWPSVGGCDVAVRPPLNTTKTYTAYVAQDYPAVGPPTVDVRATASVSVTNVGWMGHIQSMTASPSTVQAGEASVITVALSEYLPSEGAQYATSIYDETGRQVTFCAWPTLGGCEVTVRPPIGTTKVYTAYVALDYPPTGPPTNDVRSKASVSVTNVGWTGYIKSFTTSDAFLVNGGSAHLEMALSTTLPDAGPYVQTIYDEQNRLVGYCDFTYMSGCAATVSVAAGSMHFYRGYVALDAPSVGPPTHGVRAVAGPVVVAGLDPTTALAAPPVVALEQQLVSQAGAEGACADLGAAAQTHAVESSVSDATLVCNASGLPAAVKFIALTAGAAGTAVAIATLWQAAADPMGLQPPTQPTDPPPDPTNPTGPPGPANPPGGPADPRCDDDDCIEPGRPGELGLTDVSSLEAEPEPDPAGAGIPPRKNCLDSAARDLLEDSMPLQYHHVATKYAEWGDAFQDILDDYELSLSVEDSARAWNVFPIPHRGPHPVEYHQWVLENFELAAKTAGHGNSAEFASLFRKWVVDRVKADPTIVRDAYWKCRR